MTVLKRPCKSIQDSVAPLEASSLVSILFFYFIDYLFAGLISSLMSISTDLLLYCSDLYIVNNIELNLMADFASSRKQERSETQPQYENLRFYLI